MAPDREEETPKSSPSSPRKRKRHPNLSGDDRTNDAEHAVTIDEAGEGLREQLDGMSRRIGQHQRALRSFEARQRPEFARSESGFQSRESRAESRLDIAEDEDGQVEVDGTSTLGTGHATRASGNSGCSSGHSCVEEWSWNLKIMRSRRRGQHQDSGMSLDGEDSELTFRHSVTQLRALNEPKKTNTRVSSASVSNCETQNGDNERQTNERGRRSCFVCGCNPTSRRRVYGCSQCGEPACAECSISTIEWLSAERPEVSALHSRGVVEEPRVCEYCVSDNVSVLTSRRRSYERSYVAPGRPYRTEYHRNRSLYERMSRAVDRHSRTNAQFASLASTLRSTLSASQDPQELAEVGSSWSSERINTRQRSALDQAGPIATRTRAQIARRSDLALPSTRGRTASTPQRRALRRIFQYYNSLTRRSTTTQAPSTDDELENSNWSARLHESALVDDVDDFHLESEPHLLRISLQMSEEELCGRMLSFTATKRDCEAMVEDESKTLPTCLICMSEFLPGEKLARLLCLCLYHEQCILTWWSNCPLRLRGVCCTHKSVGIMPRNQIS